MKKYLILLVTIFMIFIFANCSSDKQKEQEGKKTDNAVTEFDSTDLQTTAINNFVAEKGFHLKYVFKEGNSFSYRLTTLAHMKTNLQTDSSVINVSDQKMIRIADFTIESVDNDSIADIRCTISNVLLEADINNEKHSYRSGSVLDSSDQKKYLEYEVIINNPFNIRITKFGELLDIYKIDQIVNRYLEISGLKDSARTEDKDFLKDQIKNNLIKPFISHIFREVPSKKLEVESTWDKTLTPTQMMVFKIQNTNHFKISSLGMLKDNRIAVINGFSTSSFEGDTNVSNNGIYYQFNKPETESSGKIYFNIDKGLVLKSKSQNKFTISYSMQMITPQGVKKGNSSETIISDNIVELL